jgi:hypothetical protein
MIGSEFTEWMSAAIVLALILLPIYFIYESFNKPKQ